jgi:hypothetical protein
VLSQPVTNTRRRQRWRCERCSGSSLATTLCPGHQSWIEVDMPVLFAARVHAGVTRWAGTLCRIHVLCDAKAMLADSAHQRVGCDGCALRPRQQGMPIGARCHFHMAFGARVKLVTAWREESEHVQLRMPVDTPPMSVLLNTDAMYHLDRRRRLPAPYSAPCRLCHRACQPTVAAPHLAACVRTSK